MKKIIAQFLLLNLIATTIWSGAAQAQITNLVANSDDTNVTYSYSYPGSENFVRIYLDTDKNKATGFVRGGIGADYLIENNNLYKYSGTGGAWGWTYLGTSSMTKPTSTSVRWTLARAKIGSPAGIALIANYGDSVFSPILIQTLSSSTITTPPSTSTWIRCATEGGTCSFAGTRQIRYGANGIFAYKIATASIACNNATFGDPVYGVVKACDYSGSVVTTTSPTPTPTPAPVSSFQITAAPVASLLTTNSVTIQWSLSENATGQVQYGTSTAYGMLSAPELSFSYSTHVQDISGLNAGTVYHYRVISKNAAGVQVVSSDSTFKTLSSGVSPTPTPAPAPAPVPSPVSSAVYPLDTRLTAMNPPSLSMPGYLAPITEPVFKTKLTRVTDPSAFDGQYARHHYSKDSAWNRDGSLMIIGSFLLDGKTYRVIKRHNASGEYRWSHTDPKKIFEVDSALSFNAINVDTGVKTRLRQFSGYEALVWGPYEGSQSSDDGIVVLTGKKGLNAVVIVYNIKTNVIESTREFAGLWDHFDWVTISQSGKYVVMNMADCGSGDCIGGLDIYDRNMNFLRQVAPFGEHGDVGVDAAGNDVFVMVLTGPSGYIGSINLANGAITYVVNLHLTGHISCRNILRPGWCYASTKQDGYQEAFGFKLDGSQTVERFAHTRSSWSSYEVQPKAVVSMDGAKILWTSDWGGGNNFDFVAEMP